MFLELLEQLPWQSGSSCPFHSHWCPCEVVVTLTATSLGGISSASAVVLLQASVLLFSILSPFMPCVGQVRHEAAPVPWSSGWDLMWWCEAGLQQLQPAAWSNAALFGLPRPFDSSCIIFHILALRRGAGLLLFYRCRNSQRMLCSGCWRGLPHLAAQRCSAAVPNSHPARACAPFRKKSSFPVEVRGLVLCFFCPNTWVPRVSIAWPDCSFIPKIFSCFASVTHSCEVSPHLPITGFGYLGDVFGLSFLGCPELLKIVHYMVRSTMSPEKKKKGRAAWGWI